MTLLVYQRSAGGDGLYKNLGGIAQDWQQSSRAIGGFWSASFVITEEEMSWMELVDFYNIQFGGRVVKLAYGLVAWEGVLYDFRLTRRQEEYRRTLDPEWWHNKVKTLYSYPTASDTEQGNLTYNPVANSFQDDGQDFSEWETAAGDAAYVLYVTNSDDTQAWGFMGAAFTTSNADDSVYVYTDVERGTAGWNGEVSGKTPSSYEVRSVSLAGSRQDTGWSENTDSSGEYGEMEYIVSLGGATKMAAVAIREAELTAYAWPRSRKLGGGTVLGSAAGTSRRGKRDRGGVLEVGCAGFWTTLNWRYRDTSRTAAASDMISTLVTASEFVAWGRVEKNELAVKVDCDPIPQRLGDLAELVILHGDVDGNVWQGGVYAGREFVYEQAPTTVQYYVREDGAITDLRGLVVDPLLLRPGVLVRDLRAPEGGQPMGTASVFDDPQVAYIEEVEYSERNNELRYKLAGVEQSVSVLMEQLAGYTATFQPVTHLLASATRM